MSLIFIASGVLIGCLLGITGVGGGALMTPLLILGFNVPAPIAVGTDLLFSALTKLLGVAIHHKQNGNVDWRIARLLTIGSIPASLISLVVLGEYAHTGRDLSAVIKPAIGCALLLTTFALFRKKRVVSESRCPARYITPVAICSGAIVGVFVTVSSVGAGALGTAVIIFLYPSLTALQIVGTGLAFSIPLALVAGLGHLGLGNVSISLLASLLVGSLPGIWIGSTIGSKIPDAVLRPVLGVILLGVAYKCF